MGHAPAVASSAKLEVCTGVCTRRASPAPWPTWRTELCGFRVAPWVLTRLSLHSHDGKHRECADTERKEHDRHGGKNRPDMTARVLPHQRPVAGDSHDEDEDGQEQDGVQRL